MVSVCLLSDALTQHLPSYLRFSYLGRGVSLHGCSSKAQPLLLTLEEGYLLMAAPPDLEHGVAPLGPPAPAQPLLLGHGEGRNNTIPGFCLGRRRVKPPASPGILHPPVRGLFHLQKLTGAQVSCSQVVRFLWSEIFSQLFLKGIRGVVGFHRCGTCRLLAEPRGPAAQPSRPPVSRAGT